MGFEYADNLSVCLIPNSIKDFFKQVVEKENFKTAFPNYLWEDEEQKVAEEIMNQLSFVQKALLASNADESDIYRYKKP